MDLIEAKPKHDMGDMKALQGDVVSLVFVALKPVLERIYPMTVNDPILRAWVHRLILWNGATSVDSQEATVFETWYNIILIIYLLLKNAVSDHVRFN